MTRTNPASHTGTLCNTPFSHQQTSNALQIHVPSGPPKMDQQKHITQTPSKTSQTSRVCARGLGQKLRVPRGVRRSWPVKGEGEGFWSSFRIFRSSLSSRRSDCLAARDGETVRSGACDPVGEMAVMAPTGPDHRKWTEYTYQ